MLAVNPPQKNNSQVGDNIGTTILSNNRSYPPDPMHNENTGRQSFQVIADINPTPNSNTGEYSSLESGSTKETSQRKQQVYSDQGMAALARPHLGALKVSTKGCITILTIACPSLNIFLFNAAVS